MVTGYTADVCNGKLTDFKAFAIRCAHAFVVELREESMDSPIPEFKPSPYYQQALLEAKDQLAMVQAMTDVECEAVAQEDHRKILEAHRKRSEERIQVRDRLLAMRSQVADWSPPTPEHVELKNFMIQQLDGTIEYDGTPRDVDEAKKLSGAEWRRELIASVERNVTYFGDEAAKDAERVHQKNRWVKELRESLRQIHPEGEMDSAAATNNDLH